MSSKHHPRLWWRDLEAEQMASEDEILRKHIHDDGPAFEATIRGWLPAPRDLWATIELPPGFEAVDLVEDIEREAFGRWASSTSADERSRAPFVNALSNLPPKGKRKLEPGTYLRKLGPAPLFDIGPPIDFDRAGADEIEMRLRPGHYGRVLLGPTCGPGLLRDVMDAQHELLDEMAARYAAVIEGLEPAIVAAAASARLRESMSSGVTTRLDDERFARWDERITRMEQRGKDAGPAFPQAENTTGPVAAEPVSNTRDDSGNEACDRGDSNSHGVTH